MQSPTGIRERLWTSDCRGNPTNDKCFISNSGNSLMHALTATELVDSIVYISTYILKLSSMKMLGCQPLCGLSVNDSWSHLTWLHFY